jgi:polyhydroxybutyrate depolymerase
MSAKPVTSGLPSVSAAPALPAPPALPSGIARTPIIVPKVAPGERIPFVLLLHGFGASGKILVDSLGIAALAEERRFAYAAPDGELDSKGRRFWNASRACCNFDGTALPHVADLKGLLATATANPAVDPRRVFVLGYSNGGFMAHRLACDVSGIAAIASISGAGPMGDDPPCKPAAPVTILQVHGDADDKIRYEGGNALSSPALPRHPSAHDTVNAWAKLDGCGATPAALPPLDLDDKLEGEETTPLLFPGCRRPVELWTVHGGNHFIAMNRKALDAILTFLEKNPRP